jgi:hypothetical protein
MYIWLQRHLVTTTSGYNDIWYLGETSIPSVPVTVTENLRKLLHEHPLLHDNSPPETLII